VPPEATIVSPIVSRIFDVESDADLPLPRTAMLGTGAAGRVLHVPDALVLSFIHDGHLPAYRLPHGRYLIVPADLELVVDRLPNIPANLGRRAEDGQREIERIEREVASLGKLLAQKRGEARWALLDELTLAELLDYLAEFRAQTAEERGIVRETAEGVQRAIDRPLVRESLGKRPKGVPEGAKHRQLSTAIGKVDIWYWWRDDRGWYATYGGPRPKRPGMRGRGVDSAFAAIKAAGHQARRAYGKPVRYSSARLRFAVLQRDGFACHYCGRKAPEVELHVDHVIPVAEGGSSDDDNLVAACTDCNHGKADVLLERHQPLACG
jgi:hypothetical protein